MDVDEWERYTREPTLRGDPVRDELIDPRATMLEAKLRPPHSRAGVIPRTALVERMLAHDSEPVVAVVAPAGYGKTTLLAEWAAKQTRDVAWLSVDEGDNDPSILLVAAASALSRVQPLGPGVLEALRARATAVPSALASLTSAFAGTTPMTLVLDNVESVENVASLDILAELAWRLPAGSRLAYSSRSPLPLPMPLLRSRGAVLEVGRDDLAMDRREAEQLLTSAGARLSPAETEALLEQTEGWPAGLYLAGLASTGRRSDVEGFTFRGNDVLMADYLRTEILAHLPTSTVSFLTRTSVLDQLSGPLCDAVLGTEGSQAMLESLESSNLLIVPLDRHRAWYRYHRLLRDLLATELERREPAIIPELNVRAALWLERQGLPEPAIRQAQRAGDSDLAARLVGATIEPAYFGGSATDVLAWLEWFRTKGLIDRYPQVAMLGAIVEGLSGRPASAERWAAAAEAAAVNAGDDHTLDGLLALMRTTLGRHGPDQMRVDAGLALEALDPQSGLRAGVLVFDALSHLFDGDVDVADPLLAHTYDVCVYVHAPPTAATALAFRGAIAIARQEWDEAKTFADQALAIVESRHLQEYIEAGIVYAVAARIAAHDGDIPTAMEHLAHAARIRPLLTYAVPVSALIQLEIVRAYLQVGDPIGARTVLREVRDILQQRPNLGVVANEADQLHDAIDAIRLGPVGASSLTAAELRLLPFLTTHLSFPQIGERLHISRHTVKTQAISIYRKLGVSSRNEAVRQAEDVGLLAH